mmetsp:Transcript_4522/g.5845  ORF Transcript_4522/g.5845 Transcript_4522/m.5845 type:complete len:264 (+) Transcript_4522:150-941(+)
MVHPLLYIATLLMLWLWVGIYRWFGGFHNCIPRVGSSNPALENGIKGIDVLGHLILIARLAPIHVRKEFQFILRIVDHCPGAPALFILEPCHPQGNQPLRAAADPKAPYPLVQIVPLIVGGTVGIPDMGQRDDLRHAPPLLVLRRRSPVFRPEIIHDILPVDLPSAVIQIILVPEVVPPELARVLADEDVLESAPVLGRGDGKSGEPHFANGSKPLFVGRLIGCEVFPGNPHGYRVDDGSDEGVDFDSLFGGFGLGILAPAAS